MGEEEEEEESQDEGGGESGGRNGQPTTTTTTTTAVDRGVFIWAGAHAVYSGRVLEREKGRRRKESFVVRFASSVSEKGGTLYERKRVMPTSWRFSHDSSRRFINVPLVCAGAVQAGPSQRATSPPRRPRRQALFPRSHSLIVFLRSGGN